MSKTGGRGGREEEGRRKELEGEQGRVEVASPLFSFTAQKSRRRVAREDERTSDLLEGSR